MTTCTFCGVGCGICLETAGSEIIGTYPSMSHPANRGRICLRGWHVHEVASAPDRLRQPLIRRATGGFEEVSWEQAYAHIAERLGAIRAQHGPDAIGFLNSARCANEDGYLLQKLARAVVGTNNVDQGTSLYRTHSIEVLRGMLGVPAATNSIAELLQSQVIVVHDIDLGQQLPTIGGWVLRARLAGAEVLVVGSRRHRIAESASQFLQVRPGTEVLLYGAMAKVILDRGLMATAFIRQHCAGFEAFLRSAHAFDVQLAAERCGLTPEQIEKAALTYARATQAMILYSTGAEARGPEPLQAMVNLALLTGNLGKPGAGIMPLAEHNNVQGGCDMGMLPQYLPGYAPVQDDDARARFERAWARPLPTRPGLDTSAMLGHRGRLKALWLDRHNPVVSATYCDARVALEQMEFVVLQNLFMTRTAEYAHVILPTRAFGEERVSFTSTERRIQLAEPAVPAPAGLSSAWEQIAEVARRLGADWAYADSAAVMAEIGRQVPTYAGADYANLARGYGRQWPCTHDRPLGTPILFQEPAADRPFTFTALPPPPPPSASTEEFPLVLAFGHSLYYWHQNTLVQHSETLKREYGILLLDYPDGFVEIHPQDAEPLRLRDGMAVRLVAGTGSAKTFARVTNEVRRGTIYVPYFLQDIARQLLGHVRTEDRAGSRTVWVRLEKA